MTTTEMRSEHRANGADPAETWSDKVVLSGAGLMTMGIERTRSNAEAFMDVVDDLVLGGLGVVEEWTSASGELVQRLSTLAAAPIPHARKAYRTGATALRRAVADA